MASNVKDYWMVTGDVEYSDGAAAYTVGEIPAGTVVMEAGIVVVTAFAGTSPTLDLGDEDNDDGWTDNADVTEGTAGFYGFRGGSDAGATYKHGKYYSAAKRITLTLGGTSLTAGKAYGLLHCLDVSEVIST